MTVKVASATSSEIIITPSRKRFTVEIAGETFKTQKSLIEKVKSIFDALSVQKTKTLSRLLFLLMTKF